jgi:glyoxylase-like metal-dependent hydrolase (beta-lactamase superfamily II)
VYAYVLARGTEAAVVDTGTPCGDGTGGVDTILVALETAGLSWANVGHVIMTHSHGDHTGNVAAILEVAPDAEGYAGAEDVPSVGKGGGATPMILPRPLIPVVDGDEVFGLRIVATPGHTPGHIAVLDEALGVLVMGDALTTNEGRPTAPPIISTGDLAEALRSVAKVASLDFETLLVGHGEPIESGASQLVREFVEACSLERILDPAESACRYPLYGP